MNLIFNWAVQPLGLVFLILLLAAALGFRQGSILARLALWVGISLLWIASAPLSANWLVKNLEADTSSSCAPSSGHLPVVVLGGGLNAYTTSENPYEVLSGPTIQRTLAAAMLDNGSNRFYLLGGGGTSRKLATYMAQIMEQQGIVEQRIITETNSRSTEGNARELSALMPPSMARKIVLVTSQLHLNRAKKIFEFHGFTVCGVGAGSLYAVSSGWVGALPYIESLEKTTMASRELLATLLYQWRHRNS